MHNQKVAGSKLNYEQWRYLSGGNVRGYKKYERNYKINVNLFHKREVTGENTVHKSRFLLSLDNKNEIHKNIHGNENFAHNELITAI